MSAPIPEPCSRRRGSPTANSLILAAGWMCSVGVCDQSRLSPHPPPAGYTRVAPPSAVVVAPQRRPVRPPLPLNLGAARVGDVGADARRHPAVERGVLLQPPSAARSHQPVVAVAELLRVGDRRERQGGRRVFHSIARGEFATVAPRYWRRLTGLRGRGCR